MSDTKELLQRTQKRLVPPEDVMGSLVRRRQRRTRSRRISTVLIGLTIALVSFAFLAQAFRSAERTGRERTPAPVPRGIFSDAEGRIAYGDRSGIWAVDSMRDTDRILLSPHQRVGRRGAPLDWSSDGSKLLVLEYQWSCCGPLWPRSLFVLNADGSRIRLPTTDYASGGSFSPDGSKVVYATAISGGPETISVVDTQGGRPRALLTVRPIWTDHDALLHPTYSPDGTEIAYFGCECDNNSQLRVMNADGSGTRVIVDGLEGTRIYGLAWSPDGERLAFGLDSVGIYVVGADGFGLTLAIPDAAYPNWSPDGNRIAYLPSSGARDTPDCPVSQMFVTSGWCGGLEIAAADGTDVHEYDEAAPGPWNPLVPEETDSQPASQSPTSLAVVLVPFAIVIALAIGILVSQRRKAEPA